MSGVIDSVDTPGGSRTLFLAVAVPEFPAFVAGQHVEFEWVPVEDVDAEFRYETVRAWPVGAEPHVRSVVSGARAW